MTTHNINKRNDNTQDHYSIKASPDKDNDETFDTKPILGSSVRQKSTEQSEYDFSKKCAEKRGEIWSRRCVSQGKTKNPVLQ